MSDVWLASKMKTLLLGLYGSNEKPVTILIARPKRIRAAAYTARWRETPRTASFSLPIFYSHHFAPENLPSEQEEIQHDEYRG